MTPELLQSIDLMSTKNRPRQAEVRNGAIWFDVIDPDWWTRVDLKTLDLGDAGTCMLGQLYGSFWDNAPMALALVDIDVTCDDEIDPDSPEGQKVWDHVIETFVPYGLTLPREADDGDYTRLTSTWRALIQGRRNHTPPRSTP